MNASKISPKSLSEIHSSISTTQTGFWRRLLAFSGPAFMVSVGYMDPGNWATDIAGGSQFGYTLIWVLLMSNLMALLLQSLSARLGLVRGLDLAQASRETYNPLVNFILWFLAEIAIAACDLAEVLGMAIGLQLLFNIPLTAGVCITVLDTFLLLFLQSYGIRKMEAFILGLISVIGMAFLAEMIFAKPQISELAAGFIPSIPNNAALYIAIGIIGATVMPHNLYLHSALVQTRKIERNKKGILTAIKYNFIDSAVALNLAFFVNAAILILAASTFFKNELFNVSEIKDAHQFLAPLLGTQWAPILFAVALICAGQSSTITGTLAGQIVMEGYLNLRIQPWLRRLITRLIAIIPALLTIIIYGEDATGDLLILSQVILSLQLGFAIIPLIHLVSDKEKMKPPPPPHLGGEPKHKSINEKSGGIETGNIVERLNVNFQNESFAIKNWVKILAWTSAIIIVSLNVKLVMDTITGWISTAGENAVLLWFTLVPLAGASGILLLYIIFRPFIMKARKAKSPVPHGMVQDIGDLTVPRYKRIAIALDFSETDILSISHAIALGKKDAEYLLIHIVETAGATVMGNEIEDYETGSDKENLDEYVKNLQLKGFNASIKLGYGNPKREIPKIVNDFSADLLIMGAHGHRMLKDLIFGTTVEAVRHNLKIPVLIVRK